MESWRGTALERGDAHDTLLLGNHVLQGVGHHGGALDTRTDGQVDLYGKLVTVGVWHHALRQLGENPGA